ncbi:MAG: amidase [Myxococcota bacterium]
MNELIESPATVLAARIRTGELTARAVLEAHIARTDQVNPAINALVVERFDAARGEADEADARIAAASAEAILPPLLGVPFTAKEFMQVEGLPNTAGSVYRMGQTASKDAPVVTRMREAGAILLGLTNVPEGGLWMETYNAVYGRTNNPWDLKRTCGGSSGGEGALVAAGGSAIGVGADVGGSIRLPSGFCGIVGHKPTGGLVPTQGHWPTIGDGSDPALTVGPMVRCVADVLPILRVMAGEEAGLPSTLPPLGRPRLHVLDGTGAWGVQRVVKRGVQSAAGALEAAGAQRAPERPKLLLKGLDAWATSLLGAGGESFDSLMSGGGRVPLLKEMALATVGRSKHIAPVLIVLALERMLSGVGGDNEKGRARIVAMRAELEALLGEDGLLLCPLYPTVAPRHGVPLWRPFGFLWTAVFNAMHFPVTVVPVGFDAKGVPLCVQIVGPRGADVRTIAAAACVEAALGKWSPAEPA